MRVDISTPTTETGRPPNDGVVATTDAFKATVAQRFGVLPNFFCSAPAAAGLIEELWAFAKSAYLDSPLPSLFKERLFVHLSRFCEVRYCIVRHVGFLVGEGRPAGDAATAVASVQQALALLVRPVPDDGALLEIYERLRAAPRDDAMPAPETPAEVDLFDALTVIFLVPNRSAQARAAVRHAVGDEKFELLTAFLAFVRTAHYWTETHPELAYEPDVAALLAAHPDLAAVLLDTSEAEAAAEDGELRRALDANQSALRESEERYRAFVTASSDVVYKMSPDWTQMRQLDGQGFLADTDEPSADWREAYILPEDRATVDAAIDSAIREKRMFELEHRVRRADGTIGWTSSRAVPMLDAHGAITEWLGAAKDVSEHKRNQEALRESEARLSATFEGVPAGVAAIGLDGKAIIANAEFRRFLPEGVAPSSDFENVNRWKAWDEERRPLDPQDFPTSRALRGERVTPGQEMIYTDDEGRKIWTNVATVPVLDDDGQVTGVVSAITDIDERKRADAAVRESEERFRLVADNISQLAWTCDSLGNVNWYNQRWLDYTGLSFAEMRSWGWEKVQHPDHVQRVVAGVERAAATGEPWEDTFPLRRYDDQYRWFYSQAVPIRDAAGKIVQWFGTNTDITELREAEAALRKSDQHQRLLLAELQHRVRNTLAVVRSIARRTAENSSSVEEMLAHFQGRLDAFSRVQAALTRNPNSLVNLTLLVEDELVAHAAREGERVKIRGPDIMLEPRTAERLSLAIHELTTNAVKHGALSNGRGSVIIEWNNEDGRLDLSWRERGVDLRQPPKRRGFGMELLLQSLPFDLQAETSVNWRPHGVEFHLKVPLKSLQPDGNG